MKEKRRNPSIVVCRHGQSLANILGDVSFIGDDPVKHKTLIEIEDYQVPLTELGVAQAKQLGKFLHARFGIPDAVVDSGYLRAVQTRVTALETGYSDREIRRMYIRTDDRFRERECGTLRKVSLDKRESLSFWEQHQKDWKANPYQSRPLGGESVADMVTRTRQAILEIRDDHPNELVFVFCHGHTMRSIEIPMAGLKIEESIKLLKHGWIPNCEIHFYEGTDRGWKKVKKFNPLKK
jgi:broad specificity phosphatase PhoE